MSQSQESTTPQEPNCPLCPLCSRPLGDVNIDDHHLIPKAYKGKIKEKIHRICHVKIHATFKESELKNHYHTWDRLNEHEEIQKFVEWVAKKPSEFYDSSKQTNNRKGKK